MKNYIQASEKEARLYYHGGFYNDGNSEYTTLETFIDFENLTVKQIEKVDVYGQFAANGHYQHIENEKEFPLPADNQLEAELFSILEPLFKFQGYYSRISHKFFFFVWGRIQKVLKRPEFKPYVFNHYDRPAVVLPLRKKLIWVSCDYKKRAFHIEQHNF